MTQPHFPVLTYVSHSVEARGKVDDDQIPLGLFELGLQLRVAGQLIHPSDEQGVGVEDVVVDVGVDQLVGQQVEPESELEEQFVLPLLDQSAGGDDQALPDVVAQQQFLDVEPGHDRLAGAGVVGEQEPQRSAGEKLSVDGADLMGQRTDVAGGDREHRVEQPGQRDALGLSYQFEVGGVSVERPAAGLGDGELVLVLSEDDLLPECARVGLVGQLQSVGAVPLGKHDSNHFSRNQPVNPKPGLEFLEQHVILPHSIA